MKKMYEVPEMEITLTLENIITVSGGLQNGGKNGEEDEVKFGDLF